MGAMLYVRRNYCPKGREFKTRHELAAELIAALGNCLKNPLDATADGAYATRDLMQAVGESRAAFVSRLRKDAEIYEPEPGPYKGVGRRPTHGKRLPCPMVMFAKCEAQQCHFSLDPVLVDFLQ